MVTVIVTVLPASPAAGVYVKLKGEALAEEGLTVPVPFSVIVTLVALPPKVLPATVTAVVPQVLPEELLRVTAGGLTHPQEIEKMLPVVVHREVFLTVIV